MGTIVVSVVISVLIQIGLFALFYILVVGRLRARIEREIADELEKTMQGVVVEFNRSALANTELLEERVERMRVLLKECKETQAALEALSKSSVKKTNAKKNLHSLPKREPVEGVVMLSTEDYADFPKERIKKLYGTNAQRSERFSIVVNEDGVKETEGTAVDMDTRIVELYEEGYQIPEIAARVNMSQSEIEMILGFAGKL